MRVLMPETAAAMTMPARNAMKDDSMYCATISGRSGRPVMRAASALSPAA